MCLNDRISFIPRDAKIFRSGNRVNIFLNFAWLLRKSPSYKKLFFIDIIGHYRSLFMLFQGFSFQTQFQEREHAIHVIQTRLVRGKFKTQNRVPRIFETGDRIKYLTVLEFHETDLNASKAYKLSAKNRSNLCNAIGKKYSPHCLPVSLSRTGEITKIDV